jgi:hypothetical protein
LLELISAGSRRESVYRVVDPTPLLVDAAPDGYRWVHDRGEAEDLFVPHAPRAAGGDQPLPPGWRALIDRMNPDGSIVDEFDAHGPERVAVRELIQLGLLSPARPAAANRPPVYGVIAAVPADLGGSSQGGTRRDTGAGGLSRVGDPPGPIGPTPLSRATVTVGVLPGDAGVTGYRGQDAMDVDPVPETADGGGVSGPVAPLGGASFASPAPVPPQPVPPQSPPGQAEPTARYTEVVDQLRAYIATVPGSAQARRNVVDVTVGSFDHRTDEGIDQSIRVLQNLLTKYQREDARAGGRDSQPLTERRERRR